MLKQLWYSLESFTTIVNFPKILVQQNLELDILDLKPPEKIARNRTNIFLSRAYIIFPMRKRFRFYLNFRRSIPKRFDYDEIQIDHKISRAFSKLCKDDRRLK